MPPSEKAARIGFEGRIVLLSLLAGLPGSVTALIILWNGIFHARTQWTLTVIIVGAWLGFPLALRRRGALPLPTPPHPLLPPRADDARREVMREVNTLGSTLREQRLGALEATTLLRTVMREIDVAIFAFDEHARLRLVNRAGERLLAAPPERLLGQTAAGLNMESRLDGPPQTTL